ncbi:MAG TPA: zinc ABC transporter substrate-binding protein [Desulfuromonadales bacterium]|jgi:zinc transport system substrate-binding protein
MHTVRQSALAVFLLLLPLLPDRLQAAEAPRVVVSIKPLHSIVAGVMAEVAVPELLLSGGESPHSYALRPSQARALARADVIFWIGPELETFLIKPLQSLGRGGMIITVIEAPGMHLLPVRSGGVWENHEHDADEHPSHASDEHAGEKNHGHDHEGAEEGMDPHLWLDPRNAKVVARLAAAELGRVFPAHRARMEANAEAMATKLDALDAELHRELAPVRGRPFIVFHDAYQYFEARYGLSAAGAITLSPEQAPGAQRLREIRKTIRDRGARCVFSEPQFTPRLVATVIEGSGARQGVLDPLGGDGLKLGPEAYFSLMRQLGENLRVCLQSP